MTIRVIAAAAGLCVLMQPVWAHRLDEYAQVAAISVFRDLVTIDLRLTAGQLVSNEVIAAIDTDADGLISVGEQALYIKTIVHDLSLSIDGKPSSVEVNQSYFPSEAEIRDGVGIIAIRLEAPLIADDEHHLKLTNAHMPDRAIYLVNALVPLDQYITIGAQDRTHDQSTYELSWLVRKR